MKIGDNNFHIQLRKLTCSLSLSLFRTQFPVDYRCWLWWITSSFSLSHTHFASEWESILTINTAVAMRHLYKYLLVFNRFHPTFRIRMNNKKMSCGVLKTKVDNSQIFYEKIEILIIKKCPLLASHMTLVIRLTINGDWYSHSENKKPEMISELIEKFYFISCWYMQVCISLTIDSSTYEELYKMMMCCNWMCANN